MTIGNNEIEEVNENFTESVIRVKTVWSEKHYDVWIVKFDDMPTITYGVVNRETQVIENLQPILYNARTLAKQFGEWLDGASPNEEALRLMSTGPQSH